MLRKVNSTPPPNPEPNGPIGLETNSRLKEFLIAEVIVTKLLWGFFSLIF
jgi:hypothetical protein